MRVAIYNVRQQSFWEGSEDKYHIQVKWERGISGRQKVINIGESDQSTRTTILMRPVPCCFNWPQVVNVMFSKHSSEKLQRFFLKLHKQPFQADFAHASEHISSTLGMLTGLTQLNISLYCQDFCFCISSRKLALPVSQFFLPLCWRHWCHTQPDLGGSVTHWIQPLLTSKTPACRVLPLIQVMIRLDPVLDLTKAQLEVVIWL